MVNSYYFIALSKDKKKIKGKVEASSIDELRSIIRFHDYYLIKYRKIKRNKDKFLERTIKEKDIHNLCKNMALMLRSGQSLNNVLDLLGSTTNNRTLKEMINYTKIEMTNGQSFTSCLKKYNKYFSKMFISMVEIGEKSSTLIQVFEYLSSYYDNINKIKTKIINALFYPALLIILTFAIILIMCLYVLPMYQTIFTENNIDLPFITKSLFIFSDFISNNLILVILSMILILLVIPYISINLSHPYDFMGLMVLLFFIINPLTTIGINIIIGSDIKKLWWIPILFSIIFLLSYWLILNEIILDLIIYAIIYLILGIISMFISFIISMKKKK